VRHALDLIVGTGAGMGAGMGAGAGPVNSDSMRPNVRAEAVLARAATLATRALVAGDAEMISPPFRRSSTRRTRPADVLTTSRRRAGARRQPGAELRMWHPTCRALDRPPRTPVARAIRYEAGTRR